MKIFLRFAAPALAVAVSFSPLVLVPTAAHAAPNLGYKIALSDGKRTIVRTRRELAIGAATGTLAVNKAALKNVLARLKPKFAQPAVNAKPYVSRGQVKIFPGAFARVLNVPMTAERLAQALAVKPGLRRFAVSVDKKPPVLTAARLKGINGVLASFQTRTSPNPKRNHNIGLAVADVTGTLLSPGEVFSLNGEVGKRTQARGYRTAPVFVNAEKVPGIGGGVSQVTGTLFNAAALAGLKIVEVNPHSRPVAYLPLGRDATVAYGELDLKFANNTKAPVYVDYAFANRNLRATIFGAKVPGKKITLRPVVQRLGPGKVDAQLYRVTRVNGKVAAKEQIFTHKYRWDATKKE